MCIIDTLGNEVIRLRWSKAQFLQSENRTISFDEEICFEESVFAKMDHIRGLHDVRVSGTARFEEFSNQVTADIHAEGIMIVPCSIKMSKCLLKHLLKKCSLLINASMKMFMR